MASKCANTFVCNEIRLTNGSDGFRLKVSPLIFILLQAAGEGPHLTAVALGLQSSLVGKLEVRSKASPEKFSIVTIADYTFFMRPLNAAGSLGLS
jgi:hypothetical protein